MKFKCVSFMLVAMILSFASCSKTITNMRYLVTVMSTTDGTATGGGLFDAGSNATLIATPQTGYAFTGWYKDTTCVSTDSVYTFAVTDNVSLQAKFKSNVDPNFIIADGLLFRYTGTATSVIVPSTVIAIGNEAFKNNNVLKSVTIPSSVTYISESAFSGCKSLTSVTLPSSVTSINEFTFSGCSSLKSVTIPSSVTTIGDAAFQECTSLTSVVIPNSVTTIDASAFYGCTSLTSVSISSSVTSLEENTFYNCTALKSITLPASLTTIGRYTFAGCSSLTSVTIPSSVNSIDDDAFTQCTSLASITVAWNTPLPISYYVFYNVPSSCILHVPAGTTAAYRAADVWNQFTVQ